MCSHHSLSPSPPPPHTPRFRMPRPSSQGGNGSKNKAKYCPISIPSGLCHLDSFTPFLTRREQSLSFLPFLFLFFFFFLFLFLFLSVKNWRVSRFSTEYWRSVTREFCFRGICTRKWINLWISRAYRGWYVAIEGNARCYFTGSIVRIYYW